MGVNQRARVRMTAAEVDAYLSVHRAATLATIGSDGLIHQVAMYFAWIDASVYMLSKERAQKVLNLRRDPRCSLHVESGKQYDELAGVNVAGHATILEDDETLWRVAIALNERQAGPWEESRRAGVSEILRKRVVIRLDPRRTVSWDHAKLRREDDPAS